MNFPSQYETATFFHFLEPVIIYNFRKTLLSRSGEKLRIDFEPQNTPIYVNSDELRSFLKYPK